MAEYSGFFNALQSSNGTYDRTYDASDFAKYFALFIGTGVFIQPADQLKVVPKSGLTVTLKAGNAFIDGYWYELDEDMDITLSPNSSSYTVNDVIAITLDKSTRTITANKKEAVTSTLPVNDGTKHELIVCTISLGAGVSTITESVITDRRSDTKFCGFVTGVVDQIDAESMFSQLESQFNDWFEEMKDQLSTDAAGNLQLQIDGLSDIYYKNENLIIIKESISGTVSNTYTVINLPLSYYGVTKDDSIILSYKVRCKDSNSKELCFSDAHPDIIDGSYIIGCYFEELNGSDYVTLYIKRDDAQAPNLTNVVFTIVLMKL